MKNLFWFPFNPSDYLVGVKGLTLEEQGAYMQCLCVNWESGAVPSDISVLALVLGVTPRRCRGIWERIAGKFELGADGMYRNARIERDRVEQLALQKRRSDGAKARWAGEHMDSI